MFHSTLLTSIDSNRLTVIDFLEGKIEQFVFNGRIYNKNHALTLHRLLSTSILENQKLSKEHFSFKTKNMLLNLNFSLFIKRCFKDGILENIEPVGIDLPTEENKEARVLI